MTPGQFVLKERIGRDSGLSNQVRVDLLETQTLSKVTKPKFFDSKVVSRCLSPYLCEDFASFR